MRRWAGALIAALMVGMSSARAQDSAPALPSALYVLNNAGQVSQLDTSALTITPITPPPETPDAFIIDLGVDALGERLAYRTANGLFVRDLASGAVRTVEGSAAGLPAFRGRGETIAFAPQGDALAYTTLTGGRVYFDPALTTTPGGLPVFTDLREGVFVNFAWSPGGTYLIGEVEGGIWWVYRREGTALALTSVVTGASGTAWVSDTALVFAPLDGGLRQMRLDAANAQDVLLDDTVVYALPALNTADALVFFGRAKNDAATPPGFGRLLRLERASPVVETISEVQVALTGLRWIPGAELLLAFQGGALALLEPISGEILTLPYADAVAYAWSPLSRALVNAPPQRPAEPVQPTSTETPAPSPTDPPTAAPSPALTAVGALPTNIPTYIPISPTFIPNMPTNAAPLPILQPTDLFADVTPVDPFSLLTPTADMTAHPTTPLAPVAGVATGADGFFLASDARDIVQVWWLPRTGQPAARFTNAPADVTEFAVASGGRRAVYVSRGGLWLQRFEIPQPLLLTEIEAIVPITPDFSPDGTLVAYADENPVRGGIWLVSISGTSERLVPNSSGRVYRRPQFSTDGNYLLVDVYISDGGVVNAVVDLAARTIIEAPLAPVDDGSALTARWLSGGRYFVIRDANNQGEAGLYIYNASTPGIAPVQTFPLEQGVFVRAAAEIAAGQIRAALEVPDDASLRVVDLLLGQQSAVKALDPLLAPRFSPDGSYLAGYASLDEIDGIRRGALVLEALDSGSRMMLSQPPVVWSFRWVR
jgi:hypothetical protein